MDFRTPNAILDEAQLEIITFKSIKYLQIHKIYLIKAIYTLYHDHGF